MCAMLMRRFNDRIGPDYFVHKATSSIEKLGRLVRLELSDFLGIYEVCQDWETTLV